MTKARFTKEFQEEEAVKQLIERVLVNTFFNVRGEPILCSSGYKFRSFMRTDFDTIE